MTGKAPHRRDARVAAFFAKVAIAETALITSLRRYRFFVAVHRDHLVVSAKIFTTLLKRNFRKNISSIAGANRLGKHDTDEVRIHVAQGGCGYEDL